MPKRRITVTIDAALLEAGLHAVAEGSAESVSGWVSDALQAAVERAARLRGLVTAVADYEAEFGVITPAELASQSRADRAAAVVVRGGSRRSA